MRIRNYGYVDIHHISDQPIGGRRYSVSMKIEPDECFEDELLELAGEEFDSAQVHVDGKFLNPLVGNVVLGNKSANLRSREFSKLFLQALPPKLIEAVKRLSKAEGETITISWSLAQKDTIVLHWYKNERIRDKVSFAIAFTRKLNMWIKVDNSTPV